ncbi:MAG: hypothetical protein K0S65_1081 [Labilithrix sp.]|nr:hypothetical protein [Labilithrix sp.]
MQPTKKHLTQNPGRDDVHEQREPDQPREGVVEKTSKPERSEAPTPKTPDQPKP